MRTLVLALILAAALALAGCAGLPTGKRSASVDWSTKTASYSSDTRTPEQIKAEVAAGPEAATPENAPTPAAAAK